MNRYLFSILTIAFLFGQVPANLAQAASAAVQERLLESAPARIEQYRKGDVRMALLGADGKPLVGATVRVRQVRHEFLLGGSVFPLVYELQKGNSKFPLEKGEPLQLGRITPEPSRQTNGLVETCRRRTVAETAAPPICTTAARVDFGQSGTGFAGSPQRLIYPCAAVGWDSPCGISPFRTGTGPVCQPFFDTLGVSLDRRYQSRRGRCRSLDNPSKCTGGKEIDGADCGSTH